MTDASHNTWISGIGENYSNRNEGNRIINSDNERISKKIIDQQQKERLKNTMYKRMKDIAKELEINIPKVGAMKISTWKRLVKYKMKNKLEERLKREMEGKAKSSTMKEYKWKMKAYILKCNGEDVRDIMLIRLHMWQVQMNYKKETECVMCPL